MLRKSLMLGIEHPISLSIWPFRVFSMDELGKLSTA